MAFPRTSWLNITDSVLDSVLFCQNAARFLLFPMGSQDLVVSTQENKSKAGKRSLNVFMRTAVRSPSRFGTVEEPHFPRRSEEFLLLLQALLPFLPLTASPKGLTQSLKKWLRMILRKSSNNSDREPRTREKRDSMPLKSTALMAT